MSSTASFTAVDSYAARRHRCECCERIFECQLCTVQRDSLLHRAQRSQQTHPETPVLVCPTCAQSPALRHVRTTSGHIVWDYLTGKPTQRMRKVRQ